MLIGAAASAFIAYVTVERGLSANTIAAYRRDLDRFQRWCDQHRLIHVGSITSASLAEFNIWCRDPNGEALSATSVARINSCVRGLFTWLVREGHLTRDVSSEISSAIHGLRLPKALSVNEVTRIIESAKLAELPALSVRNVALIEFLYGSGARISEAVGADVDDIDLDDASAVVTGKGLKQRRVPLGSVACGALEAWLVRGRPALAQMGSGSPKLFLTAHGTPMSRQAGFAVIREAAKRAGITTAVGPHTLRHSCATHLMEAGADVRVVQELLGHASVQTTQIYTMVTAERIREAHALAHPRAR